MFIPNIYQLADSIEYIESQRSAAYRPRVQSKRGRADGGRLTRLIAGLLRVGPKGASREPQPTASATPLGI